MMENKNGGALKELRRNRERNYRHENISNSRQLKLRPRAKDLILTDAQTLDYTKSSAQMQAFKIECLENQIRELQKENMNLKNTIMNLKASNYIQIDEQKVKKLIQENEKFQQEAQHYRKQYEDFVLEKDFLTRFNKNLKVECESLTKEVIHLKLMLLQYQKCAFNPQFQDSSILSSEKKLNFPYRSASSEVTLTQKKQLKKKQGKGLGNHIKNNSEISCTQVSESYFSLKRQTSAASLSIKTNRYKY